MQQRHGFTLTEILVSITIVSVLAAVLVPNLLSARTRAFDTVTRVCLKEVSTQQVFKVSQDPYEFDKKFKPATVTACGDVAFSKKKVTASTYTYQAKHKLGKSVYAVSDGTGVVKVK